MGFKGKMSAAFAISMMLARTACAFSVDFAPGTNLVDAIRALGYKAGVNVVINGNLSGTVSMHMDDTTFEEAIRALSIANDFSYEFTEGAVLVAPKEAMNVIETYKLKHLDPLYAKEQMGLLVEETDVYANKEAHTISIVGSTAVQSRVLKQLEKLDVAQQQVNIKATVIELAKSKTRSMGLGYASDLWSKDTSIAGYNGFKFTVTGSHEETLGKGNVLARPNVTTFDGRKATIMMGDKVPVFTTSNSSSDSDSDTTMTVEYKDVGVKLEVLPRINDVEDGIVTMVLKPSVSTISQWVESGNNKAPQISERSAETTVRVKSGETILLGGLLKDEEIKSIRQIPFLAKLPVLGELFKTRSIDKRETEIVIAITPIIVNDEDGKPQVQMQKLTPRLQQELSRLQNEKEVSNIDSAAQASIDTRNAELEKENEKMSLIIADKKEQIRLLRDELRQSNESMEKLLKAMKKKKKSKEVKEDD